MPGQGKYYVVFGPSRLRVMQYLLPTQFQHCCLVRNDFNRVWTVIEDTASRLEVYSFLVEDYPTIEDLAGPGRLCIPVERSDREGFRWGLFFNCVEVVKAYLGIRNPFILTPKQLYRYLYDRPNRSRKKGQATSQTGSRGARQAIAATKANSGQGVG